MASSGLTRRAFNSTVVVGAAALAAFPREALASNWETVTRESGILVSTREEDGREFPSFRGIGRVSANIWQILAVVEDADRHQEWMHKCNGSKLLSSSENGHYVWNRTDAPNPVKDRDIVLKGHFEVHKDGKDIWTKFKQTKHAQMPPIPGVIRMPRLQGHYHLVAADDSHTLVEYRANAAPGGSIPKWLVKLTTKDLPLRTLINLRKRVKSMSGKYDAKIKHIQNVAASM